MAFMAVDSQLTQEFKKVSMSAVRKCLRLLSLNVLEFDPGTELFSHVFCVLSQGRWKLISLGREIGSRSNICMYFRLLELF